LATAPQVFFARNRFVLGLGLFRIWLQQDAFSRKSRKARNSGKPLFAPLQRISKARPV